MASYSVLSAGSRVISGRGGQADSLDPATGARSLPPPYLRCGETWGGSRPIRCGQAGTLARCECKVPWQPRPLPPPYP